MMELAKKITLMNKIIQHLKETNLEDTVPFILMGQGKYPELNSKTDNEYKEIQAELKVKGLVRKTGNSLNGYVYFFLEDKAYTISDVKELFYSELLVQPMLENTATNVILNQYSPTASKPKISVIPSINDTFHLSSLERLNDEKEELKKKKRESNIYWFTMILGVIGIISFFILIADSDSVKGIALQITQYFTKK